MKTFVNGLTVPDRSLEIVGSLSGKKFLIPDDKSGFPLATAFFKPGPTGKNTNDSNLALIQEMLQPGNGPDVLSNTLKLGLFIPSTKTTIEQELWSIFKNNAELTSGIGIHTVNVITSKPKLATAADVAVYRESFLEGLQNALVTAKQAQPLYFIMGMSIEHIVDSLAEIEAHMGAFEAGLGRMGLATWHEAATAALSKFGATRIALLTPFDPSGLDNACQVFTDMGFEVVRSFGFGCQTSVDICHVPSAAKKQAILQFLDGDDVDAIVQCGTNFSLLPVIEETEAVIGKPILGINQTLLWYALREAGVTMKLKGAGQLFKYH
jgi:maleate isomerase